MYVTTIFLTDNVQIVVRSPDLPVILHGQVLEFSNSQRLAVNSNEWQTVDLAMGVPLANVFYYAIETEDSARAWMGAAG